MKTVLVSAIICALCSIIPVGIICAFGVDETPATWDSMTIEFLGGVASTLLWVSVAIWAAMRLRRGRGRSISRRIQLLLTLFAAGYIVALALVLFA